MCLPAGSSLSSHLLVDKLKTGAERNYKFKKGKDGFADEHPEILGGREAKFKAEIRSSYPPTCHISRGTRGWGDGALQLLGRWQCHAD